MYMYVPTKEYLTQNLNDTVFDNPHEYEIDQIKDFTFSTKDNCGFILHDKNMITILKL